MTEAKRGKNVAITGTILQLVFSAGMLAIWLYTGSLAAMACTWALAAGVLLWLMVVVLFYCRQLAGQEEIELAEIASHGEKGTIFEDEGGAGMHPAASRLATMERWVVPIFTVLWACGLAAVGLLTIKHVAALEVFESLAGVGAAELFVVLIAFMAFLFSRYCTGMGTERSWRLLRATGSYLLVNVLLITGVMAGLFLASREYVSADRIIAYIAPGVQLLLAVELVLNVILDLYRPRVPGQEGRPPFDSRLFNLVAQPDRVGHTIAETLNYQFGFEVSRTWFYQLLSRAFVPLIVLGILVMFLMSTIVIVPEGNEGILFRFGVPDTETVEPGVSLKWPWPIDRVELHDTGKVYEVVLGEGEDRSEKERAASYVNGRRIFLWTEEHGDRKELDFLVAGPKRGRDDATKGDATGGEEDKAPPSADTKVPGAKGGKGDTTKDDATKRKKDKVLPSVDVIKLVVPVQYRIKNAFKFAYGSRDSHALLEKVAYQMMARYCASATLTSSEGDTDSDRPEAIMTHGRAKAARKLKKHIQAAADELDLGVVITYVGLVSVHPPKDVAVEYQNVLKAERTRDEKRYEGQGEANRLLTSVASTPAEARKLAQAVRVVNSLESIKKLIEELAKRPDKPDRPNGPNKLEKLLASKLKEVKNILDNVNKEIKREEILNHDPGALVEYREELRANQSLLADVAKSPGTFEYDREIAKARKLADKRLDNVVGEPAEVIAKARVYRWAQKKIEEGRLVSYRARRDAYRNNPEVYKIDFWLDALDAVPSGIPKYILAADRDKIEIRLNLEKQVDPMAGAMSGEETDE